MLVLATVLMSMASASVEAPTFQVIDVPMSPGKQIAYNWSMSRDGAVATGVDWGSHYWTKAEGVKELTSDKGEFRFRGVSADGGTLVGSYRPGEEREGHAVALWRAKWEIRGERKESSFATSASGDGSIVVTFNQKRAWHPDTGEAVTLPSVDLFLAAAITPDGRTIVGEDSPLAGDAAKWNARTGQVTALGEYTGELAPPAMGVPALKTPSGKPIDLRHVWARGVSADASVIVGYIPWSRGPAVRWTKEAGWESLGWLPALAIEQDSIHGAFGVSDDGSRIVGRSQRHAILWTAKTGILDINDVLSKQGANLDGWTLTAALGISGDGSTVVGTCERGEPGHRTARVWIADFPTIPEKKAE